MRILYGYTNCTDRKYNEIFAGGSAFALLADQKYHSLLIKGLSENGAEVLCASGLPINRSITKKLFIKEPDEVEDGVLYHYIKSINLPILRQIGIYSGTRKFVKKQLKAAKGEDTVILCDCLNLANAYGMLKAAKKYRLPIVFIVTDIPEFQRGKLLKGINDKIIAGADGFVLLTGKMSEKINPENKPFVVIEGHSDASLSEIEREARYEYAGGKKVVIYAGSLLRLYGIGNLVEGFIAADIPDAELRVYGDGDYREELEEICKTHKNVKYMGVKPNAVAVEDERRAALLVNPRPTAPEYTKYSFPSKNMEYMASGTPVMTTALPGMPREYYPLVEIIDDETPQGIAKKLKEFFAVDAGKRYEKGAAARRFVLENKSNKVQAAKIIEFIEKIRN